MLFQIPKYKPNLRLGHAKIAALIIKKNQFVYNLKKKYFEKKDNLKEKRS